MANPRNNFSDNVDRWLSIADLKIDYYTQFIKAWIPFNAWYMVSYYDETISRTKDRDIIDHIKKHSNLYKNRIISLLSGNDSEANSFKFHFGRLHSELENHIVPHIDKRLTFTQLTIERNPINSHSINHRGLIYRVAFNSTLARTTNRVKCEIFDSQRHNQNIYLDEIRGWDVDELNNSVNYIGLNPTRKDKLRICFEEVNPNKPINIVVFPERDRSGNFKQPRNSIEINRELNLYFINDVDLISKILIEMLYQLRCILFHGEINPTETNQGIYEHAYHIQKVLIQELR